MFYSVDFPSIYSRYKLEKSAIDDDEDVIMRTYCGNDVVLLPPAAKKNSPFDLNVPYHMDGVEYILDHAIQRLLTKNHPGASTIPKPPEEDLDLDDEFLPDSKRPKGALVGDSASHELESFYNGGIEHPLLLTEAPMMPRYTRGYLMQLAYEAYGASSLCLGIDSLFSLLYDHHHNYIGCRVTDSFGPSSSGTSYFDTIVPSTGLESRVSNGHSSDSILYPQEALVIGSGYETTHIMPVTEGRIENAHIARIGIGGHQITDSLNRSVQLLYPQHKVAWSKLLPSASMVGPGYAAAEAVKEQDCLVAPSDYTAMLREVQHNSIDTSFFRHYQFAYEPRPIVTISEEERKMREVRRQENADRLREMSRRKKEEKLIQKSNRMDELESLFTARNNPALSSTEVRSIIRRAGFDEAGDEDTAAFGGPHDRVVQELAEVRKYIDRFADDTIQAERQATMQPPQDGGPALTPWSEMTLEAKLATMDTRLPLTIIADDDLDENEKELKRAQMKVKQMTLTKIRRGHERALARAANSGVTVGATTKAKSTFVVDIDEDENAENGENGDTNADQKKRQTEVEITLDMSKDLMLLGLEELQLQRKAIWARLQKYQKDLADRKNQLKVASEEANKAKVEDIASFASVLQGGATSSSMGGSTTGFSSMNGVGSIANAIGARSSRAKKADMMLFNAAATAAQNMEMDPETMERLSILRMDHPDMMSVKASQVEAELKSAVDRFQANLDADRQLIAKVDDEILSRLEPEVLRIREAESYQLTLGVNRIRAPEILFQPSIIGLDQMGLSESVHATISRIVDYEGNAKRTQPASSSASSSSTAHTLNLRSRLTERVYLTGGNCAFENMSKRVHASLAADLPVGSPVRVIQASSATQTAWRGAALFSNSAINQQRYFVPISAYLEEGADRLHEKFLVHFASNRS